MVKDNKSTSPGLDLVTPIVEILNELGTELFKWLFELGKFIYKKWRKNIGIERNDA